jgi:hypothetical protein
MYQMDQMNPLLPGVCRQVLLDSSANHPDLFQAFNDDLTPKNIP